MIRTVICDDEAPALDLLTELLGQISKVEIVDAFQSAEEAVACINAGGIDLAFFDVEMPELSGVDAVKGITVDPKPLLIFATAHPEYAVEAFGIDAIDFVLKPFDETRIAKSVEKAERMLSLISRAGGTDEQIAWEAENSRVNDVVTIRDGGSHYLVSTKDIIWIEAAGDYSVFHKNGRELAVRRTISSLEMELAEFGFARVHRSSIVAVNQVSAVKRLAKGENEITMLDGTRIKSSRSYRETVEGLTS